MLYLGRRIGQQIVIEIDGRIVDIVLTKAEPGWCELGIHADRDIKIDRREYRDAREIRETADRASATSRPPRVSPATTPPGTVVARSRIRAHAPPDRSPGSSPRLALPRRLINSFVPTLDHHRIPSPRTLP